METLNVTEIEPSLKHPTIFKKFDHLRPGETLIIRNDHDPKPLYDQMLAEKGKAFEWEYLQKGPDVYEVKITRLGAGDESKTIGEIVVKDYRKAEVFRKFGLDYCCGGRKTLKDVCAQKGLDAAEVTSALLEIDKTAKGNLINYNDWEPDFLADYIVNRHHKYVLNTIPMLTELSAKVVKAHGEAHPELREIAENYTFVAEELLDHMPKEEQILFPYIKKLTDAKKGGYKPGIPAFDTIANPIKIMEDEHYFVGIKLEVIRKLSNNFTPPAGACTSYRVLFAKLEEFANDLHEHIHLENNILFPKAVKLERELRLT